MKIQVHNLLPIERKQEPVTLGIPFARGELKDAGALRVRSSDRIESTSQARAQCFWGDGSVRWALLHFLGDLRANGATTFDVTAGEGSKQRKTSTNSNGKHADDLHALKVTKYATRVVINTGELRF